MVIPPYLKKGDTIGMVCPAGFMAPEKWQRCVQTLQEWGYGVELGATMNSHSGTYFSGTDEERLADVQSMLDNRKIKAVLFARGGYGVSRIIDAIDFSRFLKHPKWLVGYSDLTLLHAHVNRKLGVASLHAPMAGAFNVDDTNSPYLLSLRNALAGKKLVYQTAPHSFNQPGKASGQLVGGNLTLVTHAIGTKSAYKFKKRILFLEDIGEQLYAVDRMFRQLKRCGALDQLAALIIGGFTEMKDTDRPFGQTVNELIRDVVPNGNYPVCFQFPVSHDAENYALKVGVKHTLKVSTDGVTLSEQ